MRRLAVCLVILFFPSLCLAEGYTAKVEFPILGKVQVEAYSSLREPGSRPYILLKQRSGRVGKFDFEIGKEYSSEVLKEFRFPARVKIVLLKGLDTPLVVGVAGMQGGSDSTFETIVIGAVNGGLRDLVPDHPVTHIEDAVCIGLFGKDRQPGILAAKFIWGADEAHPEPHHYRVTEYRWTGSHFDIKSERKTKAKYTSGVRALGDFGFDCREDITETLAPDVR